MREFDVLVIGAGAAGLMCAAKLGLAQGARRLRIGVLDHSDKLAEKIRISGGGRCNFTNVNVSEANFVSENQRFARTALMRYTSADFITMVKTHHIPFHEKHKGQLFCDRSSEDIIHMLVAQCNAGHVQWLRPHTVQSVVYDAGRFKVESSTGVLSTRHLVVATGGLPVPKIGASDFGLRLAKQFGHALVDQRPALVPLLFDASLSASFSELAGLALPVLSKGSEPHAPWFDEDVLFTHRGLSGPAILQASSYWNPGQAIVLNLSGGGQTPEVLFKHAMQAAQGSKAQMESWLAELFPHWPKRLVRTWLTLPHTAELQGRKVAELGKKQLNPLVNSIVQWAIEPSGTEGYKKAEVMRGGVSTADLNAKTLESRKVARLYFIGEVVDVTGWLGGYNFQWAWSSGVCAAHAILSESA